MNSADRAFALAALAEHGSITASHLNGLALSARRAATWAGTTTEMSAFDQDDWTKVLQALTKEGITVREVTKSDSRTSGKWLAPVRNVPCRRAVYTLKP